MRTPQPVCYEVVPPRTVQRLISGRGGEVDVWFTRCIGGWEPEIYEIWTLARDGIREVHCMIGSKSATILSGRLFTPNFSMHENSELISWVADLSTEVSNVSMFLDHFVKLELIPRLGLKKLYVYPWGTNPTRIPTVPIIRRTTFTNVPINLRAAERRARDDRL